ncbi:C39 family peptidase [Candidatus Nomurabacteria bacterium]|nr:C39 family peptidase [Candidatus Nomurabacteria bacterium]
MRISRRIFIIAAVMLAISFGGLIGHGILKPIALRMESSVQNHRVDRPFEIAVDGPAQSFISPKIEPFIDGEWHYDHGFARLKKARFIPKSMFKASTTYTVKVPRVSRLVGGSTELKTLQFTTEDAPGVESYAVNASRKASVMAMNGEVYLKLTAPARHLRNLELQTTPKYVFRRIVTDDQSFVWRAEGILPESEQITIRIYDKIQKQTLVYKKATIAAQPKLYKQPRKTSFGKTEKAILVFERAIENYKDPVFEPKFSVDGHGAWRDNKTYEFQPSEIKPGQTYSYTLPKGLRTDQGGILLKAQTMNFATNGVVVATPIGPFGDNLARNGQVASFQFNQVVERKSAEKHVRVSGGSVSGYQWQGNILKVSLTKLGYQQTVRVWIGAGVQPEFGLPGVDSRAVSFTTDARTVKLSVPYYKQVYAQSCEAASLRMALAYRGIHSSDWVILNKFGYKPRSYDKSKEQWDDPNLQFVGDVNGRQGKLTGWGVYAGPVAAAAGSFGRNTTTVRGVSANFVASQIHAGNPVILWGIWGDSAQMKTWKTPQGKTVSGPIPMHVRLVVGVKGEPHKPLGFYVNDPITGPTYWSASYLEGNAAAAGSASQAVAIL